MPGIFGSRAPLLADLNLVLQVFIAGLLLFGYYSIRRGLVSRHRKIMISAVALNLLAIIFLMIPSNFLLATPQYPGYGGYGPLSGLTDIFIYFHMIGGGLLMLLALYLIASMYNYPKPNRLRTRHFETLMRLLLVLWLATMVGGFFNYTLKYIL
ncbi:MAG: DUF420 domain-containing protein [Chloroflexi bacterium]|nr:DUF420 domain-containing protein [Chloroflexota bacterium]